MSGTPKQKLEMRGQFTPENSALVLVDYQVGTLQLIRSSRSDVSLRNAVVLAMTATRLKMPIVTTSSEEDHIQGPISPELQRAASDAYKHRVKRVGIVNAWVDPNFSAAIEATGRKNPSSCEALRRTFAWCSQASAPSSLAKASRRFSMLPVARGEFRKK